MAEKGHFAPQELMPGENGSDPVTAEASLVDAAHSEVTQIVPKLNILSASNYLKNVYRAIHSSRCSCGRIEKMGVFSSQHVQIMKTAKCSGPNCIVILVEILLSSRSDIEACIKLLSLDVKTHFGSMKDCKTRQQLPGTVPHAIDTLVHINQAIIKVINGHVYQNELDGVNFVALLNIENVAFKYLSDLTKDMEKICPDTYIKTRTDITIMSRCIAQKGVCVIQPEPFWSFSEINELLPFITHHEALCERYLAAGKVEDAWRMVCEVIMSDVSLVSEPLLRVICCILVKHEPIFSKSVECRPHLKYATEVLLRKKPKFGDITSLTAFLCFELFIAESCPDMLNIDTLMGKATNCFEIWQHWFHSEESEHFSDEGDPRADVSFRFLRKFTELAIINLQNFAAVKALCVAYQLAQKMKRWEVVKDVTQTIITLIPQLGLQIHCDDPENTDIFMDSMGLGKDSGLLSLVAIATHHLNTEQLQKFLHVRAAFYSQLSSSIQRNDPKIVIKFSQAVMKRLEAEFVLLPGSKLPEERDDCLKPVQHALCLAISSFEYIVDSFTDPFKRNFPRDAVHYNVLGPWQIVHEFLNGVKLLGELYSYTGDIERGLKCFIQGLRAAGKYNIANWEAIFHSKLVEHALVYGDLIKATENVQDAQSFFEYSMSALKPCLQHQHGKPLVDFVSSDKLACGFKVTNWEREGTSCLCQQKSNSREDIVSDLLASFESRSNKMNDPMSQHLIVNDINGCCTCCQSDVVASCINIMSFQAEILWRKKKSICSVSSLLERSLHMASKFARKSPCANIMELFTNTGLKVSSLNQHIKSCNKLLSETAYRSAEIYFQNCYLQPADGQISCNHIEPDIGRIHSLLDIAETAGKNAGHRCNVTVASALLLKANTNYLSVLKTLSRDDVQDLEISSDSLLAALDSVTSTLELSVKEDENMETEWENKQQSDESKENEWENMQESDESKDSEGETKKHSNDDKDSVRKNKQQTDESKVTLRENKQQSHMDLSGYFTKPVTDDKKSACSDNISDVPACISYSDKTENTTRMRKLIENFPSLVAYQTATKRRVILQCALKKICEFPHYWIYRQTSQSLVLCLWEQQLAEAWMTNQACSTQLEMAAHLTDSMNVTFQHKMSEQFYRTLWENIALLSKQAVEKAMKVLQFGGDVTKQFKSRLASLPAEWTVVQITIANFDPSNSGRGQIFVTRINHKQQPITIGLPSHRSQFLANAEKAYNIANSNLANSLTKNMEPMLDVLKYLQDMFLAGHKWLLRGQLDCVRQQSVQAYLDDAGRKAVDTILQQHDYLICYTELRSLLEVLLEATKEDILSLLECMWPPHISETLAQICINVQSEVAKQCEGQEREKRGPVILILDNELIHLPWENMPDMVSDTVTRMPSLANLTAHLIWHTKLGSSPFTNGMNRSNVNINIPLLSAGELVQELRKYRDWNICTENIHRHYKHFAPHFGMNSLYLYFGDRWLDYSVLNSINSSAFPVILSGGSGHLTTDSKLDAQGEPLIFLGAGCTAMMGSLWMMPPNDVSRYISCLFASWMSQSQPVSIRELMAAARQACGSSGLVGSGLVIYGLPVMLN